MKILVIGEQFQLDECRDKLGEHDYTHVTSHHPVENVLINSELIFDFLIAEEPESFSIYAERPVTVFLNTWRVSLASMAGSHPALQCTVFGFNGFPTMFGREYLEVSSLRETDLLTLRKICKRLNTRHLEVEDRVGMVTPRVVCMIINEAYYTVQEGTATREDIDVAMKLGTNYPFGPFEWCQKIGLKNVYRLLEAVYEDTRDERYKISALMKKEFLGWQ